MAPNRLRWVVGGASEEEDMVLYGKFVSGSSLEK